MSDFQIIVPEETTNLFTDPRFGAADPDTAYAIAGDGAADVTRYTSDQWVGDGCAKCDIAGGTYATLTLAVTVTASSYTLQAMVKRSGGGALTDAQCQAYFNGAAANWDSITARRDGWYLCTKTGTATAGSRAFGIKALEDDLLVDALQLENKAYRTTYCDGDMIGNRDDGYKWNGTQNASTSTRHAQERSGGRLRDLIDDLGVKSIPEYSGFGEVASDFVWQARALLDGLEYQSEKIPPRYLDMALVFAGSTFAGLHTQRAKFLDAVSRDKTMPRQPFALRYSGGSQELQIACRMAGGIEGKMSSAELVEQTTARLVCEDPLWRGLGEDAVQLNVRSTGTANYIVMRNADGSWSTMGGGVNGDVYCVIRRRNGNLVVGGNFTQVGGATTAYRVAEYNPTTGAWSTMGNGFNGIVYALAEDSSGNVYAVGAFTADGTGAGTYRRIAKWNGSSWSEVGASGLNNDAYGIAIDSSGNAYVVGAFTQNGAGGTNIRHFAKFDGSSLAEVGSGLNGSALAVVIDQSGNVYVGGYYTADGTGAGTYRCIAKWDGSALSEVGNGISGGGSPGVQALALASNGDLYIGGGFTSDGPGTVTLECFARFDGAAISDLGAGISYSEPWTQIIHCIAIDDGDKVYLGGYNFASIGGVTLSDYMALYDGSKYYPLDINLNGTPRIQAMLWHDDVLVIGFMITAGTASYSGTATATNGGAAKARPKIKLKGPGAVSRIYNSTTEEELRFSGLTLGSGETATLDTEEGTFTSDLRGNILSKVEGDVNTFGLLPGANTIAAFIDDASASGCTTWEERYLSGDGRAA